ncbi:MAG: hypothetical protein Q9228_004767 [Teloschistes exilis]
MSVFGHIANVVKSVRTQLLPKPHADSVVKSRSHRRTNLLALEGETTLSENDWSSEESENSHEIRSQSPANLGTPKVQRVPPLRGLLTRPSTNAKKHRVWDAQREGSDIEIPPIVFRAFNDSSQGLNSVDGFIAGSFVGKTTIPMLPTESQYFRELERHLAREHSGDTPLVSKYQNLMRVIHHAIRRDQKVANSRDSEWKIATINLSQFPGSVQGVWHLNTGEHSSKAFGEWVGK